MVHMLAFELDDALILLELTVADRTQILLPIPIRLVLYLH